ncbi:hypothetical protein LTR62_002382 [Meristemomyces frigidus]|uniref:Uncharacterized protein n=1 Tax=Meristemomyces frigidus TaxID=1508187 RepID=A0AAN7TG15_9PEZI|nr:hypothetical protein LTR62_002382 [Meristemomyces frigidus]
MAEDNSLPPGIAISRAPTETRASSRNSAKQPSQWRPPSPKLDTENVYASSWRRNKHESWKYRNHSPDVEWHIKWTTGCFPNGRVLVIDYISNEAAQKADPNGKRHVVVRAAEFQDLAGLQRFYADPKSAHGAALRVIHVQNATWATLFLLKEFNIDNKSDIVGMETFSKWSRYEKPRHRNGKPFPNGRSFRQQTDPWRKVSRTAFGLDYLKAYPTMPPSNRQRGVVFGGRPVDAKMMHLNAYEDDKSPHGYDVSVQRLSVYVQRSLGPPGRVSPDVEVRNPYKHMGNGASTSQHDEGKVDLTTLDNANTVIVFETSASSHLEDCVIQPRNDMERRWRRLPFFLKKKEAMNDARLAAQCTNMILGDVFHGLGVVWEQFLGVAANHVNILEDRIYQSPADESRAPELWTNQAAWLKVDKVIVMHKDLVHEMQTQLRELAGVDEEDPPLPPLEWLASTPAEYEKLSHSVQEDLVQPTNNLSDLMYKSVGIRDSRQSLQLGLSLWRLSWITFIFLPLTFMVGVFGMHVTWFEQPTNIAWWFLSSVVLMIFVLMLWYCVKHSLQRRRQTPYQRRLYENLFTELEAQYPLYWSSTGPIDHIEPQDFLNRLKWRLLKQWFAPSRTINKKNYNSLSLDGDQADDLGTWARCKRYLLRRWLPSIQRSQLRVNTNILAMAELGIAERRSSIHSSRSGPVAAIQQLAKTSTPVVPPAGAEPSSPIQQISNSVGLRPLSLHKRRMSSSTSRFVRGRSESERPSSRGSSGIMIEERNFSDSGSEREEGDSGVQLDEQEHRGGGVM